MQRSQAGPATRRERRAAARLDRPARQRGRRQAGRPAWKSPVVLTTAAGVALAAVAVAFANGGEQQSDGVLLPPSMVYPAELIEGDVLGAASAPVVIELYADFQCPACRMFVTQQLRRLVTEFVQPGVLRIEARDIAFLGRGTPDESLELAAGARCAAEQDRYWQFHDYVFWNQGRENRGDHDAAFIAQVADAAGVEPTGFQACLARQDVRSEVRSETSAAAGKGVDSTPTLVVNGTRVVGVPNYDELAGLIRSAFDATTSIGGSGS